MVLYFIRSWNCVWTHVLKTWVQILRYLPKSIDSLSTTPLQMIYNLQTSVQTLQFRSEPTSPQTCPSKEFKVLRFERISTNEEVNGIQAWSGPRTVRASCRGSCRQDSVVSKQAQSMTIQRTTEQSSTVQYSVQHNKTAQCSEGQTTEQSRTVQGQTGAGSGSRSTVQCGHALGPTAGAGKTGTQTQVLLHRRHPRPVADERGHWRDDLAR